MQALASAVRTLCLAGNKTICNVPILAHLGSGGRIGVDSCLTALSKLEVPESSSRNFSADAGPTSEADVPASSIPSPTPSTSQAATSTGRMDRGGSMLYGARMVQPLKSGRSTVGFEEGVVHINNTFNNCTMTLTDLSGNVKAWTSSGSVGFKNSAKMKPLAAEKAAEELALKAVKMGYISVVVKMKGMGRNKQHAVSSLSRAGLRIKQLQEITPIAYNGCRLKRKRRV